MCIHFRRPAALQGSLERVEVLCHCGAGSSKCSALHNWQRLVPVVYVLLWEKSSIPSAKKLREVSQCLVPSMILFINSLQVFKYLFFFFL